MSRVNKHPPIYDISSIPGKAVIRPRKALLTREPKTANRIAAFDELHRELAVATETFLHKGDGGRQGVYDVSCALIKYLTSRGIPLAALEPLTAIQTAITDADNGTTSPIFTPKRNAKGGRPPVSDMQRAFEGKLAVIMECCVLHCKAEGKRPYVKPAAELAAKLGSGPIKMLAEVSIG